MEYSRLVANHGEIDHGISQSATEKTGSQECDFSSEHWQVHARPGDRLYGGGCKNFSPLHRKRSSP